MTGVQTCALPIFIATGALMSQTTFLQKESIPAIAHLVELRSPQQKEENG